MGKTIEEMTEEELDAEIAQMRSTRIPTQPLPKAPKRVGAKSGKRRSVFDQLMDPEGDSNGNT